MSVGGLGKGWRKRLSIEDQGQKHQSACPRTLNLRLEQPGLAWGQYLLLPPSLNFFTSEITASLLLTDNLGLRCVFSSTFHHSVIFYT